MAGMTDYQMPGVYPQDVFPAPEPGLLTGVPVFLGYANQGFDTPRRLTLWPEFEAEFGPARDDGYLAHAVRGFFENDGLLCYVVRLPDSATAEDALRGGLEAANVLDDVDLVCAPDLMRDADHHDVAAMQREILEHCWSRGDRFAVLDGRPDPRPTVVETQRDALAGVAGRYGALYYPWLAVPVRGPLPRYVPPCGHVAGAYSRSDQRVGVHKAPANEVINGALDLQVILPEPTVGRLYRHGVNCLRALPGRGIRVWGARTLSDDPAQRDVNARRVLSTIGRWVERFMTSLVHEPNDVRLWVRIVREVAGYLDGLFQRGVLKGGTAEQAFFVKCDGETNAPAAVAAGLVVTQIGVALAAPAEFTVVRIIHGASGVTVSPT
jgi:phage tail sheath protein FI